MRLIMSSVISEQNNRHVLESEDRMLGINISSTALYGFRIVKSTRVYAPLDP